MAPTSAARTNLTSQSVSISDYKLGEGAFRECYEGTYVGGNRNQQEAACKSFKTRFRGMENEYFADDFRIADRVIDYAEEWNEFCPNKKEITVSRGDIISSRDGVKYLVEPYIRDFGKFTSNSGWIAPESELGWKVLAMEAFSHYTYHRSGGSLLVCDLQGRYRADRHGRGQKNKSRFELSDPAICSRKRLYGPTDLGEKGIESFFCNHRCNQFCNQNGRWQKPRSPNQWFQKCSATSMFSSRMDDKLRLGTSTTFKLGFDNIMEEEDEYDSDDSRDSWDNSYASDEYASDDSYI